MCRIQFRTGHRTSSANTEEEEEECNLY